MTPPSEVPGGAGDPRHQLTEKLRGMLLPAQVIAVSSIGYFREASIVPKLVLLAVTGLALVVVYRVRGERDSGGRARPALTDVQWIVLACAAALTWLFSPSDGMVAKSMLVVAIGALMLSVIARLTQRRSAGS